MGRKIPPRDRIGDLVAKLSLPDDLTAVAAACTHHSDASYLASLFFPNRRLLVHPDNTC